MLIKAVQVKKTPLDRNTKGFSMIELLAVVTIVIILLSVAGIGIQNIDRGQAGTAAAVISESAFQEARNLAMGQGTEARVLIHNDPKERDRYLRYILIAYKARNLDSSGEETSQEWKVSSRGIFLPDKTYFHPALSRTASQKIDGLGSYADKDEAIRFPGEKRSSPNYYYYEFTPDGLCSGASTDPGGAFITVRGALPPNAKEPIVHKKSINGFIVWRNGNTTLLRDTKDLAESL